MTVLASHSVAVRGGTARVRFGDRADGDHHADLVPADVLEANRQAMVPLPWTWLDEVHGTTVVTVTRPGQHAGATADAAVTKVRGAVLGVWVGDCAPIALVSPDAVIGAVHAGWRGIAAGVLPAAVGAMRALGAGPVEAHVGPHIHPGCYEFGRPDLDELATRFGPTVRSTTSWGTPALDVAAAVAAALAEVDARVVSVGPCTACEGDYWSHRARGDLGRQAMAVWMDPA